MIARGSAVAARGGVWVAFAVALLGCPAVGPTLTVRVQSGLRAGYEIGYVEARAVRGSVRCGTDAPAVGVAGRALSPEDQRALGAGTLTVAELTQLDPGVYTVRARFRQPAGEGESDDSGRVLVERCAVTNLSASRVVRIALTTDCLGVSCPDGAGDAAYTECLNGRCVDPRCDPDDAASASFCCDPALPGADCVARPTLCAREADCGARAGEVRPDCALPRECIDGVCVEPDADECGAGRYCSALEARCVDRVMPARGDAGLADGGPVDAGPLDAAVVDADRPPETDASAPCVEPADCSLATCLGRVCDDGNPCTYGDVCGVEVCGGTPITCASDPCIARSCNGSASCATTPQPDGTPCADDGNPCTSDVCVAGGCAHPGVADNAPYDGDPMHRCCGGVPTVLGSDTHCDSCGNSCGGLGCVDVLGQGFSCNCPISDARCMEIGRGNCYDGDGTDPLGYLCQCQSDSDCSPGQNCCNLFPRHVCAWRDCPDV